MHECMHVHAPPMHPRRERREAAGCSSRCFTKNRSTRLHESCMIMQACVHDCRIAPRAATPAGAAAHDGRLTPRLHSCGFIVQPFRRSAARFHGRPLLVFWFWPTPGRVCRLADVGQHDHCSIDGKVAVIDAEKTEARVARSAEQPTDQAVAVIVVDVQCQWVRLPFADCAPTLLLGDQVEPLMDWEFVFLQPADACGVGEHHLGALDGQFVVLIPPRPCGLGSGGFSGR